MKALPILALALAITAAGCGESSPTPPTNNPPPANNTAARAEQHDNHDVPPDPEDWQRAAGGI